MATPHTLSLSVPRADHFLVTIFRFFIMTTCPVLTKHAEQYRLPSVFFNGLLFTLRHSGQTKVSPVFLKLLCVLLPLDFSTYAKSR